MVLVGFGAVVAGRSVLESWGCCAPGPLPSWGVCIVEVELLSAVRRIRSGRCVPKTLSVAPC